MRHFNAASLFFCLMLAFSASAPAAASAEDSESLLKQGEALSAEGRFADALEYFKRATAANPKSSVAFFRQGGMEIALQRYDDSIQSFQNAVELDSSLGPAFLGMAIALIHTGRYDTARLSLDEALQRSPQRAAEIEHVKAWLSQRSDGESLGHSERPMAFMPQH